MSHEALLVPCGWWMLDGGWWMVVDGCEWLRMCIIRWTFGWLLMNCTVLPFALNYRGKVLINFYLLYIYILHLPSIAAGVLVRAFFNSTHYTTYTTKLLARLGW